MMSGIVRNERTLYFQAAFYPAFFFAFLGFPVFLTAVSYTHLDVYKRQPLGRSLFHPVPLMVIPSSIVTG